MPAALSTTGVTFAGSSYAVSSVTVKDMRDQLDVTSLSNTRKQYQVSPLFSPAEATMEFLGYGPRAGTTGSFSLTSGVSGLGATVTSSSTTFSVNDVIKSQATLQFSR